MVLLFCVAIFACQQGQSVLEVPTQSASSAQTASTNRVVANAGATTTNSVSSESVDFIDFAECALDGAGEEIRVTGRVRFVNRTTTNGNLMGVTSFSGAQGLRAIGLTTGIQYQSVGTIQGTFNVRVNTLPQTFSLVGNRNLISHGRSSNLLIHENAQLTVNANGTVTVFRDHVNVGCTR